MGVVYRAVDESLERFVAIKVLHGEAKQRMESLLQEAIAQARINHPNVVHIYYVSKDPTSPFLAMELVEGGSLASLMKTRSLTFHEAARFALQLAEAMRQASALGIVHGDIKPQNVLLDRQQQVKLTDFGLALVENKGQGHRIAGTPQYMAPEMWEGITSAASDMYALGVTMYEMTFGCRPLNPPAKASASEIAMMHRTQPIEFPEPWPADIPHAWGDIIERLLAKTPQQRYPDYGSLVEELQTVQPIDRPAAGKVPRLIAWVVDVALLQVMLGVLQAGLGLIPASNRVGRMSVGITGLAMVFLLVLWSARWGRTPGKAMLQLRVVDRYGLPPPDFSLFIRGLWVTTPVWVTWFGGILIASGWEPPVGNQFLLVVLVQLAVTIDAVCSLFFQRGQTLHDRLLDTEVVLG